MFRDDELEDQDFLLALKLQEEEDNLIRRQISNTKSSEDAVIAR